MRLGFRLPKVQFLKSRKLRLILRILAILVLITVALIILVDHNITPVALSIAQAQVRAIASDAIFTAVQESIQDITYEDLIHVTYDGNGKVAMVQANSVRMNQIASQTALAAQEHISAIDMRSVSVPIGTVFGGPVFSGRGPKLPVRVMPAGSVMTEFGTNFGAAGVNQSRHEIYLTLKARMQIAIPLGSEAIEVTLRVPVAETVIVGEVPQTYLYTDERADMLNLLP